MRLRLLCTNITVGADGSSIVRLEAKKLDSHFHLTNEHLSRTYPQANLTMVIDALADEYHVGLSYSVSINEWQGRRASDSKMIAFE